MLESIREISASEFEIEGDVRDVSLYCAARRCSNVRNLFKSDSGCLMEITSQYWKGGNYVVRFAIIGSQI